MFRLTRPITHLIKRANTSFIRKSTPSLIRIHKYNFAGGHKSAADLNHPHLGGPSPGEDPSANTMDNPYLWDPHYVPCEESDYERHHFFLEKEEKDRYAIPAHERVKNLDKEQVLKRISTVLRSMERAQTDNKLVAHHTHLYNDLGLDSLDQVEFGLALENEFDIEILDEEAEQIVTVGDAVELICEHPTAA